MYFMENKININANNNGEMWKYLKELTQQKVEIKTTYFGRVNVPVIVSFIFSLFQTGLIRSGKVLLR